MTVSYREALDLVEQLQLDLGSHLAMSLAGWKYPAGRDQLYLAGIMARLMNVTRGKDEKPFSQDWPWPDEPRADDVTDTERAELKTQLKAKSAFGQLRTE